MNPFVAPTLLVYMLGNLAKRVGATPSYCKTSYAYNALNVNEVQMEDGTTWTNSRDHSKWCNYGSRRKSVMHRRYQSATWTAGSGRGYIVLSDNEDMVINAKYG